MKAYAMPQRGCTHVAKHLMEGGATSIATEAIEEAFRKLRTEGPPGLILIVNDRTWEKGPPEAAGVYVRGKACWNTGAPEPIYGFDGLSAFEGDYRRDPEGHLIELWVYKNAREFGVRWVACHEAFHIHRSHSITRRYRGASLEELDGLRQVEEGLAREFADVMMKGWSQEARTTELDLGGHMDMEEYGRKRKLLDESRRRKLIPARTHGNLLQLINLQLQEDGKAKIAALRGQARVAIRLNELQEATDGREG